MLISSSTLLAWYREGIFPMSDAERDEISLYSPDPRGIIDLHEFHVPMSLAKTLRSGKFEIRIDTAFREVLRGCAAREETWISPSIAISYIRLHDLGYAHSVESWMNGVLAGGLYGVSLGGAFFGESMFTLLRDASKAALVALVDRMKRNGMTLLDTQYVTPHLSKFGAREIPRNEYMSRLGKAIEMPDLFSS